MSKEVIFQEQRDICIIDFVQYQVLLVSNIILLIYIVYVLFCSPIPVIDHMSASHYTLTMHVLGGVHNLLSLLVLISYFLSNHPRLPTGEEIKKPFR